MTAADAGLSHRPAALRYLRSGRVTVLHAATRRPGGVPDSATVRVVPAVEGQPHRTVLLDQGRWTCTCQPGPQSAAAPRCGHVLAATLVLGRGGPQ